MDRKLIKKKEEKISILQIIGFIQLQLGIISLMICAFFSDSSLTPSVIAVSFFVIMIGYSFAFPSLLEGNQGLSTMRIIVFMVTNVICMLLLKIGWAVACLTDIGLDEYWMGVIAFVFGAKATQSFFESKMADVMDSAARNGKEPNNTGSASETVPDENLIKLAIKQFSLKHLEGVVGVGRSVKDINGKKEIGVQINVNDEKYIEKYKVPLEVIKDNGDKAMITPNVVFVGNPTTHNGVAGSGITNSGGQNGCGTIGCIVKSNAHPENKYILSCQHVLNHDHHFNTRGQQNDITFINQNGVIAKHTKGLRTHEIDAGLAEITQQFTNANIGKIGPVRTISISDLDETVKVTLTGYDVDNTQVQTNEGVIINNEFYSEFEYAGEIGKFGMEDLIVISNKNGDTYTSISKPGYSGSLVIDSEKRAIGLLVGGDLNYSYAIPINKILTYFKCSII